MRERRLRGRAHVVAGKPLAHVMVQFEPRLFQDCQRQELINVMVLLREPKSIYPGKLAAVRHPALQWLQVLRIALTIQVSQEATLPVSFQICDSRKYGIP